MNVPVHITGRTPNKDWNCGGFATKATFSKSRNTWVEIAGARENTFKALRVKNSSKEKG